MVASTGTSLSMRLLEGRSAFLSMATIVCVCTLVLATPMAFAASDSAVKTTQRGVSQLAWSLAFLVIGFILGRLSAKWPFHRK